MPDRQAVNKVLRRRRAPSLTNPEWDRVHSDLVTDDWAKGERPDEIAEEVVRWRRDQKVKPTEDVDVVVARSAALAAWNAQRANADRDVVRWRLAHLTPKATADRYRTERERARKDRERVSAREEQLHFKPVTERGIKLWVEKQAAQGAPEGIPLDEWVRELGIRKNRGEAEVKWTSASGSQITLDLTGNIAPWVTLEWVDNKGIRRCGSIPRAGCRALTDLIELAEKLPTRYEFSSPATASATTFVLTGKFPAISGVRWALARGRISLDIDPSLRPDQVAGSYRRAIEHFYGEPMPLVAERHARLLEFLAGKTVLNWKRPEEMTGRGRRPKEAKWALDAMAPRTWSTLVSEWNQQPEVVDREWGYSNTGHAIRDAEDAAVTILELRRIE